MSHLLDTLTDMHYVGCSFTMYNPYNAPGKNRR